MLRQWQAYIVLVIAFLSSIDCQADEPLLVKLVSADTVKNKEVVVPLLCVLVTEGEEKKELRALANQFAKDMEYGQQFKVTIVAEPAPKYKEDIRNRLVKDYFAVIYLRLDLIGHCVEWRLYDPQDEEALLQDNPIKIIKGKKIACTSHNIVLAAHTIAHQVWYELRSEPSIFTTKIAYCVSVPQVVKKNKRYTHVKHIYISDYDGGNPQLLVDTPTINMAPRWGMKSKKPVLFYSEHTADNVRLMKVDLHGIRTMVLNKKGGIMLPSFATHGRSVAYNVAGDIVCKKIDTTGKRITTVISNKGNNLSSNLLDNDDIIFCSDFETGHPHIYYYHAQTHTTERLTQSGYCTSPAYCSKSNCVVYAKLVHGVSQLYMYNLTEKKHEQLTFDKGNKDEPSFSPCGNFIVFAVENANSSRIAVMHLATRKRDYITLPSLCASYPTWSPFLE